MHTWFYKYTGLSDTFIRQLYTEWVMFSRCISLIFRLLNFDCDIKLHKVGKTKKKKFFVYLIISFQCKLPKVQVSYLFMCWAFNSQGIAYGNVLKNNWIHCLKIWIISCVCNIHGRAIIIVVYPRDKIMWLLFPFHFSNLFTILFLVWMPQTKCHKHSSV